LQEVEIARPTAQVKGKGHKVGAVKSARSSGAGGTQRSKTSNALDLLHTATTNALNGHDTPAAGASKTPSTKATAVVEPVKARVSAADSSSSNGSGAGDQPSTSREPTVTMPPEDTPTPAKPTPSVPIVPVAPSKTQAGVKRKADTTTTDIDGVDSPAAKALASRRESGRPIKRPLKELDFAQMQPRFKGRLTEQLKFCQRVIIEMFSKRFKKEAWPFYEPVDVEGLGSFNRGYSEHHFTSNPLI
jgi:hypothetical protein